MYCSLCMTARIEFLTLLNNLLDILDPTIYCRILDPQPLLRAGRRNAPAQQYFLQTPPHPKHLHLRSMIGAMSCFDGEVAIFE